MLCSVSANPSLLAGVAPGDAPAGLFVQECLVLCVLDQPRGARAFRLMCLTQPLQRWWLHWSGWRWPGDPPAFQTAALSPQTAALLASSSAIKASEGYSAASEVQPVLLDGGGRWQQRSRCPLGEHEGAGQLRWHCQADRGLGHPVPSLTESCATPSRAPCSDYSQPAAQRDVSLLSDSSSFPVWAPFAVR